jgi:glycosyltransferase involved in cell wall biosynthesis
MTSENSAPPRLRVVHVMNELRPSGAETMLVSASEHWAALGITCDVVATGTQIGSFADDLRRAGYGVHHIPVGKSPADFLRFRRFLRTSDYDVMHQHPEGRGYWLSLAARSLRLPVVRTVHSHFAFTGNLRLRRSLQRRHLRALGVRFVAIAPGVQENERDRFGISCELIWNWLDLRRFTRITESERRQARVERNIAPQTRVLVSVGNCSTVKNHGVIISALALLADRWDLRYLHVGVEDALATEREAARRQGVLSRVDFLGWTQNVRGVMAAADLFVMPSAFEGLGVAAMEALATGTPTVLADSPGLRDLRSAFPTIDYFEPNAMSLASKLTEILARPDGLTQRQRNEQADTCQRLFDPRRGAAEYARVFRELVKSTGN